MRQVRKIITFICSILVCLLLLACTGFFDGNVQDSFNSLINVLAKYLTKWDLSLSRLIVKILCLVLAGLLLITPLVGFIISLVKIKSKPNKGPLDFVNGFAYSFVVLGVGYAVYVNSGTNKVSTIAKVLYALLIVLHIAFEILLACDTKSTISNEASAGIEIGKVYQLKNGDQSFKIQVLDTDEKVQAVRLVSKNEEETKEEPNEESSLNEEIEDSDNNEEELDESENEENENEENENEEVTDEIQKASRKPTLPYIDRLASSEDSLRQAYSTMKNELLKHRKMKSRISKSCETFRVGYDVVAKMVVAGKSLKLYLAMDPYSVDSAIYHQRDASSKHRFIEVPLVVKIKSPLSLKKALKLIEQTCTNKEIELKSRYEEVDYSKITVEQK